MSKIGENQIIWLIWAFRKIKYKHTLTDFLKSSYLTHVQLHHLFNTNIHLCALLKQNNDLDLKFQNDSQSQLIDTSHLTDLFIVLWLCFHQILLLCLSFHYLNIPFWIEPSVESNNLAIDKKMFIFQSPISCDIANNQDQIFFLYSSPFWLTLIVLLLNVMMNMKIEKVK